MRRLVFLFCLLPALLHTQTCTDEKMLGTWLCGAEEFTVKCLMTWTLQKDGRYVWDYECADGGHARTTGRWWCDGDRVYQTNSEGQEIYGTLRWESSDVFVVTIENNRNKEYQGLERKYRRMKQ